MNKQQMNTKYKQQNEHMKNSWETSQSQKCREATQNPPIGQTEKIKQGSVVGYGALSISVSARK